MIVELSAAAEADLREIGDYIARANPTRAKSFVRELVQGCLELSQTAETWPCLPHRKGSGIRRRVHGRYLILYRVAGEHVVLHVLNGAMDIEAILFPDG